MALFKNSFLTLLLLVPFLFGIGTSVKAAWGTGIIESQPDEENHDADLYHEVIGNQRAYIHMSLPRYSTTGTYVTSHVTNSAHEIKFYGSANIYYDHIIWNPNSADFNVFVIESLDQQGNYVTQYNSLDSSHNVLRFMGTSDGIQIRTVVDQPIGPDLEETIYYLFDNTTYRMYWAKSSIHTEATIDDLPFTSGSPYKSGAYGTVDLSINGSYLDITVFYDDTFKLKSKLIDDISIFHNVAMAIYWTDNNQKFITMTYEEEPPIYLSTLPVQARPWVDTVTWNLTTNQIRSTSKIDVFAYHDKDSNRNVFTYMYIPNLVYESLISVTASFSYQYTYYVGGKGDIIQNSISLKSGDKNTFSPTWERKLLYYYIIPGSFSFAEIVFVKDGRVNMLQFDDIILKDVTDDSLLPENAKTLWTILSKFYNDYPEIAIVIGIVLVMIVMTLLLQFAPVLGMVAQLISGILRVVFMLLSKPVFWIITIVAAFAYYISTLL